MFKLKLLFHSITKKKMETNELDLNPSLSGFIIYDGPSTEDKYTDNRALIFGWLPKLIHRKTKLSPGRDLIFGW